MWVSFELGVYAAAWITYKAYKASSESHATTAWLSWTKDGDVVGVSCHQLLACNFPRLWKLLRLLSMFPIRRMKAA